MGMGGELGKYILRTRKPEDAEQFAEDHQQRAREVRRRRDSNPVVGVVVLLLVIGGMLAWAAFAG